MRKTLKEQKEDDEREELFKQQAKDLIKEDETREERPEGEQLPADSKRDRPKEDKPDKPKEKPRPEQLPAEPSKRPRVDPKSKPEQVEPRKVELDGIKDFLEEQGVVIDPLALLVRVKEMLIEQNALRGSGYVAMAIQHIDAAIVKLRGM